MNADYCRACGGYGVRPGHIAEGDCPVCFGSGLDLEGPISEQVICEHAYHCDKIDCVGQLGRRPDLDAIRKYGPNLCNLTGKAVQEALDIVVDPTFA